MKKIETTIGRLCHIRKRVAEVAPELTDFGMRVATSKATVLEMRMATGVWVDERCAIYVTEAEWAIIKRIMENESRIFSRWTHDDGPLLLDTPRNSEFDHRTSVTNRPMRTNSNFYSPYVREV